MAQPEFYKKLSLDIAREGAQRKDLERQLAAAYRRREELEMLADEETVVTVARVSNTCESVGCGSPPGSFAV
jgi:hypothetical protein